MISFEPLPTRNWSGDTPCRSASAGERRRAVRVEVDGAAAPSATAAIALGDGPNGFSFEASLIDARDAELARHLLDRLARRSTA